MPSLVFQPLVEVFLLVDQPQQRLSHWAQALAPLDGSDAPPAAIVEAYYDPTSDQAILGLRYDELALGPDGLEFLVEVALGAELGMIQPAELSDADRGRFVSERLARCTVHVVDQRQIVRALVELVRRAHGPMSVGSLPEVVEMPSAPDEFAPGALAHGSVRQPRAPFFDEARPDAAGVPEPTSNQAITEPITAQARRRSAVLGVPRIELPRLTPNVVTRGGVHRAATVTMPADQTERMTQRMVESARGDTEIDVATDPFLPVAWGSLEPGMLHARYLRSGRWVRIRIGKLSLKGATLMAAALPRVDDRIDIGLAYTNYRAGVRGVVERISTWQESAASGATTFNVRFDLDLAAHQELAALLTAARTDRLTLKPPPMRSTRRYPVEWPISLATRRGVVLAEALDVSIDGMFVKPPPGFPLDAQVMFSAMLDDGVSAISGSARVVRALSEADAKAAGLSPGYGLSIAEMPDEDRRRWSAFLTRVELRAGMRVLIGAAPARLAELQNGLVAAGYAVTGGSEPRAIAQLAGAEAHPVDAALIDATWLAAASKSRIESLFTGRKLPCVTVHGDVRRARLAVDQLLSVA